MQRVGTPASQSSVSSVFSGPPRPFPKTHKRAYTVLAGEPPDPFGFGSAAPARPDGPYRDTPGPGKYDPREGNFHIESLRGLTVGFTSGTKRRLPFLPRDRTPAPCAYEPRRIDRGIRPRIGELTGRRCACFPDEREASATPGPGSYDLPEVRGKAATSCFRSKVGRTTFAPEPRQAPRFDGRTFTLRATDYF